MSEENLESTGRIPDAPVTSGPAMYYELIAECLGQHDAIPDSPGDIFFAVQDGAVIPPEVLEIQGRIEETGYTLRRLYEESQPERYRQLFEELLSATKVLAGPKPNPVVVVSALERLQERILSTEGARKKSEYLNMLGKRILLTIGLIAVAVMLLRSSLLNSVIETTLLAAVPNYGLMLVAATLAMWLSFASRVPSVSFEDLLNPGGDMLSARHRIIYVLLFTCILALFAHAEVIGTIAIGSFSTAKISTEYVSAAIFGFACGFSEKLLASTVAPHITKILGGMGQAK